MLVIHSTYSYDSLARLANIAHQDGADPAATLAGYAFAYDRLDRITSIDSLIDGLSTFNYDATSQLVSADHATQTDEAFDWDANGNPDAANNTLGPNNQVLSDGTFDYGYDAEGRRIWRERVSIDPADDHRLEYTWDHRNRLIGLTLRDETLAVTKRIEYVYDIFNRRIAKRVDAANSGTFEVVQQWAYDGDHITLAFDSAGSLTNRYLHGPIIDQILADEQFAEGLTIGDTAAAAGEVLLPLADHLGSIRDLAIHDAVLAETEIANHIVYNSFRERVSETDPTVDHHFDHAGREYDEDAQLILDRNRWYDVFLKRYISPDRQGFAAGDTNLRRYVGNDPVNYVDPFGFDEVSTPWFRGDDVTWTPEGERLMGFEADYPQRAFVIGRLDGEWVELKGDLGDGRVQLSKLRELANSMNSWAHVSSISASQVKYRQETIKAQIRALASTAPDKDDGPTQGVAGFANGLMRTGPRDAAVGCYEMARHPVETAKGVVGFIARPLNEVEDDVFENFDRFDTAQDAGEATFNTFVGPKVTKAAGNAARAGAVGAAQKLAKYELIVDRATLSTNGVGQFRLRKKGEVGLSERRAIEQDLLEQIGMREECPPSGLGMQNPLVKEAVEKGDIEHMLLQERLRQKGWKVDRSDTGVIDPATGQLIFPDGISPKGHPVEIKPRTPTGEAKGSDQLKAYERATGKNGRILHY